MKYRQFIEDNFLIDNPKTGQLVPFKFHPIQNKYYDTLVKEYDIENRGLTVPIREDILKARREGFSSFILSLFAADDILNESPTETNVLSYKDDATKVFRRRYRNYLLSYYTRKKGHTVEEIQTNPGLMEKYAKEFLEVDSDEFVLKHNKAHFFCGTANARTGGRGGVVQKLLFSELAFYPDKKELRAREIVEGTMRQVDVSSGWVFKESTANGENTYHAKAYHEAESGQSRFKSRFYGWRDFYTEEQFELIKSEFTDKRMIPQEYPETAQEAFLSSGDRFFDPTISSNLKIDVPRVEGNWRFYRDYEPGHRYAGGADVSEGVGRHNSTIGIIDFDAKINIGGRLINKAKLVAMYVSNKIPPDLFAHEIKNGGNRFGACLMCPERNNHGFATLAILKDIYYNIWRDEQDKLGWQTNMSSKPRMLHELRTAIHTDLLEISDEDLKREIMQYPAQDLNENNVDEEDETMGHYDRVIAVAIAWALRNYAVQTQVYTLKDNEDYSRDIDNDRFEPIHRI